MKKVFLFLYNGFMKNLNVTQPYSDKVLKFNELTSHYELTIEYVKATLGNNFKDDGELQKRITKNSRKIYNFIAGRSYSQNRPVVQFLLNRTQEGREYLKDLLFEQMEADSDSAFNNLSSTPAINVANGQVIDRQQQYANQISVDAEQKAYESETYFGCNILYQGLFPATYFVFVQKNK